MWVEPRLAANERPDRRMRPWLGLLVVALLLLGAFTVGGSALWVVEQALPHRERMP